MKVTCLQDNLAKGLSVVRRAVPSRATLPITQNILVETENARVKLAATNLELSITTWIGAQIEQTGSIAVPARPLLDLISTFDTGRVDIEMSDDPYGIKIEASTQMANGQTAKTNSQLRGSAANDFPPFPKVEGGNSVLIEAVTLRNALDRVVFAAASDDARPVLTGVKMEVKEDQVTFAAADGYRLSVESAQLSEPSRSEFQALIPEKTLNELLGLLAGSTELVQIMVSENNSEAMFRIGDEVEIITQLIAGTYPDYPNLIPKEVDSTIRIPVDAMDRLARQAQVIARDGSGIVRLVTNNDVEESIKSGTLTVSSNAEHIGDSEGVIDADIEGEAGKIAFNVKYLVDLVNHARGGASNLQSPEGGEEVAEHPEIIMAITTPSSPALFRLSDHPGFSHVVMPMYVQW